MAPSNNFATTRYAVAQAGWPAVLGAGLLVFALVFHGTGLLPARARLGELQANVAAQRAVLARESRAQKSGVAAGSLPAESNREKFLQQVHDAAQSRGVRIDSAEYRQTREGRLVKSAFILPVHGTYPQLRGWLADIMNGIPALALDEFSLHRDAVGNPALDGRVRLTLIMEAR